MSTFEAGLDFGTNYLTDEAIASLVGQQPRLAASFDYYLSPGARGKIVAAERRNGVVVVTIEVPGDFPADALFVHDKDRGYSLSSAGYHVLESEPRHWFDPLEVAAVDVRDVVPAQPFGNVR